MVLLKRVKFINQHNNYNMNLYYFDNKMDI